MGNYLRHDAKNVPGGNQSTFGDGRSSHKRSSKSRYNGGFTTVNGRMNNTSEYNHDYYLKNKEKWRHGRPQGEPVAYGTVNKRLFNTEGEYEALTVEVDGEAMAGGYFLDVYPYQPQYYLNWNSPESPFYNYDKYSDEAYAAYGTSEYAANGAKGDFLRGPYDKDKIYYSSKEDRYYVITSNKDAIRQLSKTMDTYQVDNGKTVGLYSFKNRSNEDLRNDPFMREQINKKAKAAAKKKIFESLSDKDKELVRPYMGPRVAHSAIRMKSEPYLQHDRKNKSPYGGGFNKGKNTPEYNRNYYKANRSRWAKNRSRRETNYFYKMESDAKRVVNDFSSVLTSQIDFFRNFFSPVKKFIQFFYNNPVVKEAERGYKEDLDKQAIKESLNKASQAFTIAKKSFIQAMKTDIAKINKKKE